MTYTNDTLLTTLSFDEFIDVEELALRMGLDCGQRLAIAENRWAGFELDGNTLYIPIYPLYHSISYDELSARDLVDGVKTVVIGEHTYRVRLIKGMVQDCLDRHNCLEHPLTDSEWNRTIGLLLKNFPELDLVGNDDGLGKYTWCQERVENENCAIIRMANDWEYLNTEATATQTEYHGWRPVLERI